MNFILQQSVREVLLVQELVSCPSCFLKEIFDLKRQLDSLMSLAEDVETIKDELLDIKVNCEFMGTAGTG